MSYPRLWARLYNTPLLIHPDKAKVIEQVFRRQLEAPAPAIRLDEDHEETAAQRAEREHQRRCVAYAGIELQRADEKPYALTKSGIALIPVLGTLVQRGSWLDAMSGLTSYDMIASQLDRSMSDPDVRGVLLEIDSPGGEAAGLVDLADRVYTAQKRKPLWAMANEQAYSSAYWLASSAARVYTPVTGGVGSIGAVMLHVDQSKRDAMMGYAYTFIFSGEHKVDGNSHEALSKPALKWAQDEVDRYRQLFASAVAERRAISADAVLATEAGLLTPGPALEGGYIDGVQTLIETVTLLEAELRNPGSTLSGTRMAARRSTKEASMKTATPAATMILAALGIAMESVADANGVKLESAVLEVGNTGRAAALSDGEKAGEAKGKETGRADGVKAERDRIRGILTHAEAKERGSLAVSLALESDMAVDQVAKVLAAAPKQAGNQFAAAMGGLKNPSLGVDHDAQTEVDQPKISAGAIYARRREQHQQQPK